MRAEHVCRQCGTTGLTANELYSVGSGRFWCKPCSDAASARPAELDGLSPRELWVAYGIAHGWCSEPVCVTHAGLPSSPEEDAAWDEGGDPCVPAVRLYVFDAEEGTR